MWTLMLMMACGSDPDALLDTVDVEPTAFNDTGDLADGQVFTLDTAAEPSLLFEAVGATGPQHGTWGAYNVRVVQPDDHIASLRVSVVVDMASVQTSHSSLTSHLLTADFFDVATHNQASFESTTVTHRQGAVYAVTGELTLRGTTKEVSFDANIVADQEGLRASAELVLSRWAFGLIHPSATQAEEDGVDDEVVFSFNVRLAPE